MLKDRIPAELSVLHIKPTQGQHCKLPKGSHKPSSTSLSHIHTIPLGSPIRRMASSGMHVATGDGVLSVRNFPASSLPANTVSAPPPAGGHHVDLESGFTVKEAHGVHAGAATDVRVPFCSLFSSSSFCFVPFLVTGGRALGKRVCGGSATSINACRQFSFVLFSL